ncbi:MAG TPA: hypothetical protein VFV38_13255 [Ktedonobacteraceae bacterium]|nr:hypothetical protein [Ktedonobacteraceae bacterium]
MSSLPYIIATILGNLLSFIPFIGPIWGGIIAGILNGLALLGRLAGDIAKGFKQETDQEDLRSGQGLGYFTADNLEAQGQQILGVVGLEGKESVVVGWATIITSIAAGNGIVVWGPKLVSQAKNLLVGGVTTGIVTAIVSAAGSMVMSNMVSSDIAQEVSDAS